MNRRSFIVDSVALMALGSTAVKGKPTGTRVESAPVGPDTFFKIEDLPLLHNGIQTHQFCSYDRAGDNYDHEYFPIYTEPNGEVVIFDAMGPGCLYRHHMNIWKSSGSYDAASATKGVKIRYYFDGEQQPRVNMDVSTFFSSKNPLGIFRYPLAIDGGDNFRVLYCPMFFRKRLKVALSREPGGPGSHQLPWQGRYNKLPKRRNHWYTYTYHTFTEDPGIRSWTPAQDESALFSFWDPGKLGQDPKPTEGNKTKTCSRPLPAGNLITVAALAGAGSISSLHIHIDPANEQTLFQTWLKITFDGNSQAQVEAPLGGFFGANRKSLDASFAALPLGYSQSLMYCYFPMPFWKSARITIENRGQEDIKNVQVTVRYKPSSVYSYLEKDCGHFFAHYHKEFPRKEGIDYTYLDWAGTGHVVGHVVSRFDTSMEEDERTYFDGSGTPQIYGEGFEDDHNMGWGLKNMQHAIFGAIAAQGGSGTTYRFYTPDLYFFNSSVKHGHQVYGPHTPLGHEGLYQVGSEESITFFYGRKSPALKLTDEFDVGNRRSELEHGYQVVGRRQDEKGVPPRYSLLGGFWYEGEFNNVLFNTAPIQDDGVSFNGYSQFTVKIDPANRGVRLRRRTDKTDNRQTAHVYVDGQLVTERCWYTVDCEKTYRNIRWQDADFEIPRKYTASKRSITLKIEYRSGGNQRWNEYYYWVFSVLPAMREDQNRDLRRLGGLVQQKIYVPAKANFTCHPVEIPWFAYK